MLKDLFHYSFLQHAVISAILASIACGIIGTIILEKKLIMMSGGIAHTAFGGIGLGYFLGIEPMIGALFFSILAALAIPQIQAKTGTSSEVIMGMFWSLGMALGILFIALMPGYPPDLPSYLFGDILTVTSFDIRVMVLLNLIILAIISSLYQQYKTLLFDEEFAAVIGLPVSLLKNLLFVLIALTVVILIRVVGIILIIALLTVPPSIAKIFTSNLKKIMLLSSCLGIVFCLLGLWCSYSLQIPSGAAIIILSVTSYLMLSLFLKIKKPGKISISKES